MSDNRNDSGIKPPRHPAGSAFGKESSWQEREKIAFRERQLDEAMRRKIEDLKKQQEKERQKQEERLKRAQLQLEEERKKRALGLKYEPAGMPRGRSPLLNLLKKRQIDEEKKLDELKERQFKERLEKLEQLERQLGQRQFPSARPAETPSPTKLHERFTQATNDEIGEAKPDRNYRDVFKMGRGKAAKKPEKNKGDDMDR